MAAEDTDGELVARVRNGEAEAFEELLGRHRARLWSICLRTTGRTADAEDALQDTVLAAWRHLDSFRSEARFGTWVYRIAVNASLAVIRRRGSDLTGFDDGWEPQPARDHAQGVVERDAVQGALSHLSPDHRVVLVLREIGDLTYEEIAQHTGVPVQTVKSRLNRARAAMLAELADA